MSQDDPLARRAASARESLQAESRRHLVPAPPTGAPSPARRAPAAGRRTGQVLGAFGALAAVVVVVSLLVGGLWHRSSVVAPGVMTSVAAGQSPVAVVTDGSRIYVADAGSGTVTAYEGDRLTQAWQWRQGTRVVAVALGPGGEVWALDAGSNVLVKLDPREGHELARGSVPAGSVGMAVTEDAVWVLSPVNGTLNRFDPSSVTQVASATQIDQKATSVTYGAGYLWVTAPTQVQRVVPTANRHDDDVLRVPLRGGPVGVAVSGGTVWVALSSGELVRLDPARPSAAGAPRTATDAAPTALTALSDGSAVASTTAGTLTRFPLTGSPTRLAGPGAALDSLSWSSSLLVGVSSSTAELYATEVSP